MLRIGGYFLLRGVFGTKRPLPGMGSEPDLYRRDGQPLLTWLSTVQGMKRGLEDRRARPVTCEVEPDTARVLGHDRRQLE